MNAAGYISYLQLIANHLKGLETEAKRKRTTIDQFIFHGDPKIKKKPLPKLIDQYFLMVYTKNWNLAEIEKLLK